MSVFEQESYRQAFGQYLRKGTPIRLGRKQFLSGDQYVWHTQDDEKVRPSHRANDGHIFSWDDPPATGHPGTDYNCRCQAIPYVAGETEYAFHSLLLAEAAVPDRWTDPDFVLHYFFGNGETVDLADIGHLRDIVEQYSYKDGDEGALRRLSSQIAVEARMVRSGPLTYTFDFAYDFGSVAFSHGWGVVAGTFDGTVLESGSMLRIAGASKFTFKDKFEDPVGLGIEVGGDPYDIIGNWAATFAAEVFADPEESEFS